MYDDGDIVNSRFVEGNGMSTELNSVDTERAIEMAVFLGASVVCGPEIEDGQSERKLRDVREGWICCGAASEAGGEEKGGRKTSIAVKCGHGVLRFNSEVKRTEENGKCVGLRIRMPESAIVDDFFNVASGDRSGECGIVEARSDDVSGMWEQFFASGFIYPGKRRYMQSVSGEVQETYRRLLSRDSGVFKAILYKDRDKILGHQSAIKWCDRSWLIQHWNVRNGAPRDASRLLIEGIGERLSEPRDGGPRKYLMTIYRPDNALPSSLFGGVVELIGDPEGCGSYDLEYCVLQNEAPGREDAGVRDACEEDMGKLSRLMEVLGESQAGKLDGLLGSHFAELDVSKEYRELGVCRERRVMVMSENDTDVYAVCNYSSAGLNLSGLANSFRVFSNESNGTVRSDLVNRMVQHVLGSYRTAGCAAPVLLTNRAEPVPESFRRVKTYRCWWIDSSYLEEFKASVREVFGNMRKYLKRGKRNRRGARNVTAGGAAKW